jgi:ATP/maltotriose-dependent transcriptional regulator MalT
MVLDVGELERMRLNLIELEGRTRDFHATLATFRRRRSELGAPVVPSAPVLSHRERDILRLIAAGRENTEIASELHFALGTIKMHVRDILAKLESSSRTEAAVRAVRLELI